MVQGDDLFGDGVNVAARLQEIAAPAGICISGAVREQIESKLNFPLANLGERSLKNIPRPVQALRVEWRLEETSATNVLGGALNLPDKPSIAVLPFVNMSGEAEQEYFADGITEDIITALSRYRWFFVIARNSSFTFKGRAVDVKQIARELGVRYVLEGSVRKAGNRIRITGQLIEAESGNHIWAERYDRDLSDIFSVQDEITQSVVAAIEPEMLLTEGQRAARKTGTNLDAFDCVLRGMWHFHLFTPEDSLEAEKLFRRAIDRDQKFAPGWIWLGRTLNGRIWFGWSRDVEGERAEAYAAAQRAVELDERDPYAHYILALTSVISRQVQKGIAEAQRAIDLNPNFALGHFILGLARFFAHHFAEVPEPILRGMRLSPHDPLTFMYLNFLALAYYHQRDYEQARQYAERGLRLRRIYVLCHTLLASLGQLGRLDEAAAVREEMQRLKPSDFDRFVETTNPYTNPADREHLRDGLAKAGLTV